MKIIKEGSQIEHTHRVSCRKCNAELEIMAGDLCDISPDGSPDSLFYYVCPCCSRLNCLYGDDLSSGILFDLENN